MIKVIFEDSKPCPIDNSIMCENSKIEHIENGLKLICNKKLVKCYLVNIK